MKKLYSIGETAKINNVSIQALRLYDKMDLLKPSHVDPSNNYRYYTLDQFIYIYIIKYSKSIGAPLKEIKDVLYSQDPNELFSFLQNQQQKIENEIARLTKIQTTIGHIEDHMKYAHTVKTDIVYTRNLNDRYILEAATSNNANYEDIEIQINELDKVLENNNILCSGETGCFVTLESILEGTEPRYNKIYISIHSDHIKDVNLDIKKIDSGKYLCISYLRHNRNNAICTLKQYLQDNDISPKGIALEVQLLNPLIELDNENIMFELQILI